MYRFRGFINNFTEYLWMPSIDTVVFDLDGTLIDSQIDYEKMSYLIKEVLRSNGLTEPLEDRGKVYRVIQGGEQTLREYGMSEKRLPETLKQMEDVMNAVELEALDEVVLKPNAKETLHKLTELDIKLGIATRSHHEYSVRGLGKFNLTHYFRKIVARDDVHLPKPHPYHLLHTIELLGGKPETTLFIGDTTTDLTTSNAANVKFIGYWRNDIWAQRLIDAGCTEMVKGLLEIVEIVEKRS